MDDDGRSNWLSGWAGVALGRMWAEQERSMGEMGQWFANRNRPVINVAALQADNQALATENARLRQDLEEFRHNYRQLRAWAEGASVKLKRFDGQ